MRKIILSSFVAALILVAGCKKGRDEIKPVPNPHVQGASSAEVNHHKDPSCPASINELYAGQHILIGDVTVSNDEVNLYVTFNTKDGWAVKHTHLYAGPRSGMPVNGAGNPKIGNFPHSTSHQPAVTSFTYTIPLSSLPDDECIVIAAHAEAVLLGENGQVQQAETAWSAGNAITPGGSWATYSDYCICESSTEDSEGESEDSEGETEDSEGSGNGGSDGSGTGTDTGGGEGSGDGDDETTDNGDSSNDDGDSSTGDPDGGINLDIEQ